ncbi:MAG: hypothetical protein K0R02_849 [Rickettsiaceae bacterium]|jgi:hypothetical protein|nr:hypothetical protein [Rickettsiaceae bacterium]
MSPIAILRLEGLFYLILGLFLFSNALQPWSQFFYLFLLPDVSLLGYLLGARIGAFCYNTTHSSIGPILLYIIGCKLSINYLFILSYIWISHIGFDRMLGFGLKYTDGFGHTHLGMIGKK